LWSGERSILDYRSQRASRGSRVARFSLWGDNATQPVSFGPHQLIKQGAKLVAGWEDAIEELPTPVLAEQSLGPSEKARYALLQMDAARHGDERVESSGLSSLEVLSA
jgi:predicted Rossmann fold nucleotide-binding protein DprA/Smf involved in DNA uptake